MKEVIQQVVVLTALPLIYFIASWMIVTISGLKSSGLTKFKNRKRQGVQTGSFAHKVPAV